MSILVIYYNGIDNADQGWYCLSSLTVWEASDYVKLLAWLSLLLQKTKKKINALAFEKFGNMPETFLVNIMYFKKGVKHCRRVQK